MPKKYKLKSVKNVTDKPQKLLNRHFFLLWQGQFVSNLGSQVAIIALVFWIKHTTGSATLMGSIQMLASLPAIILGPIAGTFADRYSRRGIIITCDVLSGIAMLALAAMMFMVPDRTGSILICLSAVFVFTGLLSAFFNPAISAAIPDLVPENSVARANSMAQSSMQISMFFGQGTGGLLFRLLGAPIVFFIDGMTYLFSAFSEMFITIPQTIPEKSSGWKKQFQEFKKDTSLGLRYIWNMTGLRALVSISAILTFFTMPVIVLLPFYVEDILVVKADWYGYLVAAYGLGTLAGFAIAGTAKLNGRARSKWLAVSIILESAGYGLLGLVNTPIIAMTFAFLGGAAGGFVMVNITTLLQITIPSEFRGRVFGVLTTVTGALAPIAMGLAGVIADLVNHDIPLIYLTSGACMTVLSLVMLLNREVRTFLAHEQEDHLTDEKKADPELEEIGARIGKDLALRHLAHHRDALAAYEEALEINPHDEDTWHKKGVVLNHLGRFEEAVSACDATLKLNPDNESAWYNKGFALDRLGQPQDAITAYEKALEINPNNENAWNDKGVILNHLGRYEEAVTAYEKTLKINPEDDDAWYNTGVALSHMGRQQEALEAYDRAVETNPNNEKAWNNKARILDDLERYEEALEAVEKALEINPDDEKALYNKGLILHHLGREVKALDVYEKIRNKK